MNITNNKILYPISIIIFILIILCIFNHAFNNVSVVNYNISVPSYTFSNNTSIKNNNEVVFFMSSNYKELPEFANYSKKVLEMYCNYHKYKFHYIQHPPSSISPYWLRVIDFINLTNMYPENTHIIYFDLDVIISPQMFKIPITKIINDIDNITNKNWNMYVSTDNYGKFGITNFNTGVIYIKNTDWIKNFLKHWISKYPIYKWKYDDKKQKWQCNENMFVSCSWAGQSYEQGSLKYIYQHNVLNCKEKILGMSIDIFGDNYLNKHSFTFHLMSQNNDTRKKTFHKLYNEIRNILP